MAIDEQKILKEVKADVTNAEPFHDEWQGKIDTWNNEFDGKPYGNEVKGKAQVVSRDIKQAAIWQHAQVIDPFVSSPNMVRTIPITAEDEAIAEEKKLILNYQFCRDFDRYNFVSNSFNVLQREGTVVAKVSWEFQEDIVDVEVPVYQSLPVKDIRAGQEMIAQGQMPYETVQVGTTIKKQKKTIVNRPTVELLNNAYVYIDPTVEGKAETGQFMAIKYNSNMSKLKNAGVYKNLNKIDEMIQGELDKSHSSYTSDRSGFKFTDKARREFEVVEYWGNYDLNGNGNAIPCVIVWVGNIVIRMEENPYPDKEIPFVTCITDADPFSPYGKPNADLIGVDQKIQTGIKRTVLNTLNASTNEQKGVAKQSLDPINLRKFKNGEDFEFNGNAPAIWTGNFNPIPQGVFAFSESIKRDSEGLTGVRPFQTGQGSMGSATEARGALDAIAKREVDISRNFKDNFIVPILRKWDSMNSVWLEDEQITRITNKPPVPKREGNQSIDIDIEIATAETDAGKSNELSFMLQTMGPSLPFDMSKMLLAEIAELKRMPDLAKKIMEYQPQPDPMQQQIQMLEIEKLKAEIAERQSRAAENQVDMRVKSAKAMLDESKARKTHGEADLNDQEFVEKQTGQKRANELEDKYLDRMAKQQAK